MFINASNWFGWWELFFLFCFLCLFSLSFASLLFSDYSSSLISIMRPLPLFKDFSMMFRSTLKLNCMHVYYIYFKAIKSAKLILTALWLFRYFYPEVFFLHFLISSRGFEVAINVVLGDIISSFAVEVHCIWTIFNNIYSQVKYNA